jgi:hypothetical protein
MRILVKDENDNVMVLNSVTGFIPPGFSIVPEEELEAEELALQRLNKLAEVRARRDSMLLRNDKEWLIEAKKSNPTTAIEADAQTLRDLPELAETELAALTDLELIKAYDCFAGLNLSRSYE